MSPIYTLAGCCVCASVQCAACSVVLCMQMNVKCRHMGYQQIKLLIYRLAEQNDNRGICSLLVVQFTRLQTEMVISNRIQLSKSANSYQSANQNGNQQHDSNQQLVANQPIQMQISKPEWQSGNLACNYQAIQPSKQSGSRCRIQEKLWEAVFTDL